MNSLTVIDSIIVIEGMNTKKLTAAILCVANNNIEQYTHMNTHRNKQSKLQPTNQY